ncbi:uncharacterized protein SCODWIG_02305 [Saccharomycodes ludwigii]|uniref:Peptidase M16 C-terminal domain-containing protein n=1 Tax=Saccharomycodes ludwigii TaxID=36035 RepID=A0A376B7R9_9ASCO|nr:uncharacterized protein SCODWIG_02305 [Saccharomycodes ludwigii]
MTFTKLLSFNFDYAPDYTLNKYVSSRTRLQLIYLQSKTFTSINGYFVVYDGIMNDSNCSSALQHLIFYGSKKYPYKGFLKTAGNRCMCDINTWDSADHVIYSLSSTGWEGFKKILPVYVDHLFNPTLTDEAFYTAIHHIDPDSLEDKGSFYELLQHLESQGWFCMNSAKRDLIFDDNSKYELKTNSLTKNLRNLTNDTVRKFHKEMYSSDNICLLITGNVPEQELLDIVTNFDNKLPEIKIKKRQPFVDTAAAATLIPRFNGTTAKEATVELPELDESLGVISFSWITEKYENAMQILAIDILMEYLTEGSLSVFYRELIEIEGPLSNEVEYWTDDFYRTIVNLDFRGVPTEKLQLAKTRILQILSEHKVNLKQIKNVLEKQKCDYLLKFEKYTDHTLLEYCVPDFLYVSDITGETLKQCIGSLNTFSTLSKWDQQQWQKLLEHWFVENKPIILLGKPSEKNTNNEDKEKLLEKRKESIGPSEIVNLKKKLEQANKANDKPIPADLLKTFYVDEPYETVRFVSTRGISVLDSNTNNDLSDKLTNDILKAKPKNFPFFMHLEQFPSQFIEVNLLLNIRNIQNRELFPYTYMFSELFNMPMKLEDGKVLSSDHVLSMLKNETIDFSVIPSLEVSISSGIQVFADFLNVNVVAKVSEYDSAIKWIKHALFDMVFDESRLKILLDNLLSKVETCKLHGFETLEFIINKYLFEEKKTLMKDSNMLYSSSFLKDVLKNIENGCFETKILPCLNQFRHDLTENMTNSHILILGDIEKIGSSGIFEPWTKYFAPVIANSKQLKEIPPVPTLKEALSAFGSNLGYKSFIITTQEPDLSYMKVLTNFDLDYEHPDYAAVTLAANYLLCGGGPLEKDISDPGLAQCVYIFRNMDEGNIGYSIYGSNDVIKCYEVCRKIIKDYSTGASTFDPLLVKGAVSLSVDELASDDSYISAALRNYLNTVWYKNSPDCNQKILTNLKNVTINDLVRVTNKYLLPMFMVERGSVFVSCPVGKLEDIQKYLEIQGYEVLVEELGEDAEK